LGFSETPGPSRDDPESPVDPSRDEPSEGIDPFEAFAEIQSRVARERAGRDPSIWLPGQEELDQEPIDPARETGFSVDARRLRGTPQVGVRLRQTDFHRLCRAAEIYGVRPTTLARMMILRGVKAILDAELRDKGIG
jgi:hypothetical protein